MMKIRDKLFKQFKSTNSAVDFRAYKQFRNHVVNGLKESKKTYYHHYFDENKGNMKMLWKGIKGIVSLRSNNLDTISHLTGIDGSKITNPGQMANELYKKLSRTTGIFFKIRHYIPNETLICLYNSLFSSFLSYGIIVWGLTYT